MYTHTSNKYLHFHVCCMIKTALVNTDTNKLNLEWSCTSHYSKHYVCVCILFYIC